MSLMAMGRVAARGLVAGVILLAAGLAMTGCAAGEPGGTTVLPIATDLPAATSLPVAAPLPAAADLPTYAVSPTATPLPTATIVFTPREIPPYVHSRTQIRLMDRLDARPDFYCLDVPGFGDNIQLDAPLQAHTCKWDADDQLFDDLNPLGGFIEKHTDESRLCVTASDMTAGATLRLDECHFAAQPLDEQLFRFMDNPPRPAILISLHTENAGELCVGVAAGPGEPAGGRNHLRRDLTVYECDAADPSLVTWIFREEGARIN